MSNVWKESHRYSDGTCALLQWIQYSGFQIHYVNNWRKHSGTNHSVRNHEKYVSQLHGDMATFDPFMNDRVGFGVKSLSPYEKLLKQDRVPFLRSAGGKSLFLQVPGGIIFELLEVMRQ